MIAFRHGRHASKDIEGAQRPAIATGASSLSEEER
jgi:hypothetical protein